MTHHYKLRTSFVFFIFSLIYLLIIFNLYSIQIKQQNFFTELGSKQYFVTVTTMPPRAQMYDRAERNLALNKDSLAAFILPKTIKNKAELITFLEKNFPQSISRLSTTSSNFMYLKRRLSEEDIQCIQESGLEDIHLLKEPSRYYPLEYAGPITGITDIDNNGVCGVELLYNNRLAGTASTHKLERDARSGQFYFTKETTVEGHAGQPITLTIDSDLQFLAYEELRNTIEKYQAKEGAVLIMNPENGELLAMAQYPNFNPNSSVTDVEATKNKIIADVYEPGSVMKIFLTLAALEEKVVTPDELIDCENTKVGMVNGVRFSTVYPAGVIPFREVIEKSNNIGVAKVALRLGRTLYDHYTRLGFGKKTTLSWPAEQAGFVNQPAHWSRSSLIVLSFGYEVTTSLLQLARALTVLANNGHLVEPKLLLHEQTKKSEAPLYSPTTIATTKAILENTVLSDHAQKNGYKIIGKTGTANLVNNGKYTPDHNIYTFSGIIEKDNYKRIIITFIKDSPLKKIYAATVAAPLFERVAEKVLIHDQIV